MWRYLSKMSQYGEPTVKIFRKSTSSDLFTDIIEPLGHKAKERNDDFVKSYSQMTNKFTKEFLGIFCKIDGEIDWEKLVRFNSATEAPE